MPNKPQTLKGFRDILPAEQAKRNEVLRRITTAFERFGFEQMQTPTLEYASLLLGKYGDEADKLVYTFEDNGGRKVGLRYDQTVPTARVLGEHQYTLPRYFRRYQVQNVFRAEKPQKGRYREFTQCDCDIFGSTSIVADSEIVAVLYTALAEVGFGSITIEINDRHVLMATLKEFATSEVPIPAITQSIDKLDKLSRDEVVRELIQKGLEKNAAEEVLGKVKKIDKSDYILELESLVCSLGVPETSLVFNPALARGLDYYTGLIFEAKIQDYAVGSVGGGGRYDNLIKNLTGHDSPAVGFGIGFDRVVQAAEQLGLIKDTTSSTTVLVSVFSPELLEPAAAIAGQLRQSGITTELYPSATDSLGKQFKLADQKNIPYVAILGEDEIKNNTATIKTMKTGEQVTVVQDKLATYPLFSRGASLVTKW